MPEDPTKKEVHETELAGPDDRWVSVTDASRIGRRQEHTIRSWIAQGLLPVNPKRVGINKKTRQVRLSDLAKLTPILDPDAGIATDWGTLDLPSIPKQQQQLAEQMTALQQDVTGQLASLGGQLRSLAGEQEKFAEETRQTWHVHQQQYQALAHRDDEQQQLLQQFRDTLTKNLHGVDQAIRQELGGVQRLHSLLDNRVKAQDQAWKLAQQELRDLIAQTENTLRQEMASLIAQTEQALRLALDASRRESAEAVENLWKYVAGLEERVVSAIEKGRQAHEDLVATVTRLHAQTDHQFSQVGNRLEQLEGTIGQQQDEIQKQAGRVDQLATQLETVKSTALGYQQRVDAQDQAIAELRAQLQEEAQARQLLTTQVAALSGGEKTPGKQQRR
jgi:DNA repair exonuclease SbcCD ATPase subunit